MWLCGSSRTRTVSLLLVVDHPVDVLLGVCSQNDVVVEVFPNEESGGDLEVAAKTDPGSIQPVAVPSACRKVGVPGRNLRQSGGLYCVHLRARAADFSDRRARCSSVPVAPL